MKNGKVRNSKHTSSKDSAAERKLTNPVAVPMSPDVLDTVPPCAETAADYLPPSEPTGMKGSKPDASDSEKREPLQTEVEQRCEEGAQENRTGKAQAANEREFVPESQPLDEEPKTKSRRKQKSSAKNRVPNAQPPKTRPAQK